MSVVALLNVRLRRRASGGTTCLTLPVQRRCSSKVADDVANYGDP